MTWPAGPIALWWAMIFAVIPLGAPVLVRARPAAARLARWSLLIAATFGLIATALLLGGLAEPDLRISFVARHVTVTLPVGWRIAALWSEPVTASLAAAGPVLLGAAWALHRSHSTPAFAGAAAMGLVLLAGAAVDSPFAATRFVPSDGLGLANALRHPYAIAARVAVGLAVIPATLVLVRSLQSPTLAIGRAIAVTAALLLAVAWLSFAGALASGAARPTSPWGVWGGRAMVALVVAALAIAVERTVAGTTGGTAGARRAIALSLVSGVLSALRPGSRDPLGDLFGVVALGLGLVAAYSCLRAVPRQASRGLRPFAVAPGLALAALAVSWRAAAEDLTLASGALTTGGGLSITHQGASRFEFDGGHVVSVTLGIGPANATARLLVAEQREFVNRRDEATEEAARRPGGGWVGFSRVRVWLEALTPRGVARLTLRREPLAAVWPVGALLFVGWLVAQGSAAAAATTPTCESCGVRPEPGARFCSRCGRSLA
jgi:hypothetical protein